ncbi:UNVERIFIED_CONTAM: hypothetical protein RMT77_016316 [Armadillidium vulgare]
MGASYTRSFSVDIDEESQSSSTGQAKATRMLKATSQKLSDIDTGRASIAEEKVKGTMHKFETPFGLKRRSKSLDAGSNRSSSLSSSIGRASKIDRLRRRSRKKSVDSLENTEVNRGRFGKGACSLEEASKEEEYNEETLQPPKMLSQRQKDVIRETWKQLQQNVSKVGVVMFVGLFETHPDVQEVFLPFRGLASEEMKRSKQLRSHSLRVLNLIEKAVGRLDKPDVLIPLVQECGRNHVSYGAKVEHVDLIGPQLILAMKPTLNDQWTEEVEEAWTLFMAHIAFVMKTAMKEKMLTS